MFGSLGFPELLLIFVVILIVFGPRRIPEIGRTLGKAMGEFRKATDDLKSTIEREVRLEELKQIKTPSLEDFTTPYEAVSRTEPENGTSLETSTEATTATAAEQEIEIPLETSIPELVPADELAAAETVDEAPALSPNPSPRTAE